MKYIFLLIFVSYSQFTLGQVTYTSPITQHFPSTELEKINRIIKFTKDTVFINSETPYGWQTKKYVVNQFSVHTFPVNGLCDFFVCSSLDNIYTTYFQIPLSDKVEFIEVVEPKQFYRSENRYRLLID